MNWETVGQSLGVGTQSGDLTALQASLRALVIMVAALLMVRFGDKRFLAKRSAFDVVVGVLLASVLSRAINGSAALLPTIAGGFTLVLAHRFLGSLSYRFPAFARFVKGHGDWLIRDGALQEHGLKKNKMTHEDLLEDARLSLQSEGLDQVEKARMEPSGDVSFVKKSPPSDSTQGSEAGNRAKRNS